MLKKAIFTLIVGVVLTGAVLAQTRTVIPLEKLGLKSPDYSKLQKGDFSEFAGTWVNAMGDIIKLNPNGTIDNYQSAGPANLDPNGGYRWGGVVTRGTNFSALLYPVGVAASGMQTNTTRVRLHTNKARNASEGIYYRESDLAADFTVARTGDGKGVVIVKYIAKEKAVCLPAMINNMPVREIGEAAFQNMPITSIVVPEGVTKIGDVAFSTCRNLASVTLPSTLKSLGELTFLGTGALKSLTLPAGITEIGVNCFEGAGFTTINWPAGVTVINVGVFNNSKLRTIVIPEGVTEIREFAFMECFDLTSVTVPSTIKYIHPGAFYECKKLSPVPTHRPRQ